MTKRWLLPAAAALACACAGTRERAGYEVAPWADPGSYRRLGVLPFGDSTGRGRLLAERISAEIRGRGQETADIPALEKAFSAIKPDSLGLTMSQLEDLRRETGAQALLFGDVTADSFSLILLDLQSGDEAVKAHFGPRVGGYPAEEIVRLTLQALSPRPVR